VAITFDDGPSPRSTPVILDRLDDLDVHATFFCVGRLVGRHADLVQDIVRRGHQVELHCHSHESHLRHGPRWVAGDLDDAVAALGDAGVRARWFRPPYGHTTTATIASARRHQLEVVLWSAWGREWSATSSDSVARRVTRRLEPGAIVLLHDGEDFSPPGSVARVGDALGPIVDAIRSGGLTPRRLDEVLTVE